MPRPCESCSVTAKRIALSTLICAGAWLTGCSSDTPGTDEAGETTAMSSTAGESDTGDGTTTTTTTSTTDAGSTDEANFIPDEETGTTGTAPGDLGAMCTTDADCVEGLFCNGVPQFGFAVCSECAGDENCDGGNCTLTANGYFECGDGSVGQMCETDEACGDALFCAEVVNLGGLFNGNFCSECKDDSQCMNGQLCAPTLEFMDLMNIGGQRNCIDPNTQPNNQICDVDANGDEQCEGFCTAADIMGLIQIGVCGECESDADCMGNGACMPAMLGFDGVAGSVCG